MDELIKQVSEKAGISESQAMTAVDTVMDYMKDKLPGPLADQVEKAMAGGDTGKSADEIMKGIGGLMNN